MIAIGEWLFGATPFGWRFVPALAGTLSVLILCRLARRMTGSTLLGCAAGLLLALDGLHFVTSRAALLDVFVMFWILAGFACLVNDRIGLAGFWRRGSRRGTVRPMGLSSRTAGGGPRGSAWVWRARRSGRACSISPRSG